MKATRKSEILRIVPLLITGQPRNERVVLTGVFHTGLIRPMKSETPISKSETNPKVQKPNNRNRPTQRCLEFGSFGLVSCLGFRISDFGGHLRDRPCCGLLPQEGGELCTSQVDL